MPATASAPARRGKARGRAASDLRIVSTDGKTTTKLKPATDENARKYAPCRVLGHAWRHVGRADGEGDATPSGAYGSIGWVSTCSECGMRRVRWFARSGMVAAPPSYRPPEGCSRHGDDRLTMQQWRRTWVNVLGLDK